MNEEPLTDEERQLLVACVTRAWGSVGGLEYVRLIGKLSAPDTRVVIQRPGRATR
jgi:hypothetical protein